MTPQEEQDQYYQELTEEWDGYDFPDMSEEEYVMIKREEKPKKEIIYPKRRFV